MSSKKERLDKVVSQLKPELSRALIQSIIVQGKVLINGHAATKPGALVPDDAEVTIKFEEPKYVSRAGHKLEKIIENNPLDLEGKVALDAGISTGGFTDCLLQHGVKRVYGIDVGYGQVAEKIRNDDRVVILERTNIRNLKTLPEPIDIATLDLSFISLLKVLPAVSNLLKQHATIIALIKPQFEADRPDIARGGVVKSDEVHEKVKQKIVEGFAEYNFMLKKIEESPILGAKSKNKEFVAWFERE